MIDTRESDQKLGRGSDEGFIIQKEESIPWNVDSFKCSLVDPDDLQQTPEKWLSYLQDGQNIDRGPQA